MRYLLFVLVTASPLSAGEPAKKPPAPDEIARAVRELSDKRFPVREKASAFLWNSGKAGERALLKALPKADLETARRAQVILDKFRWGIYPDTPKEALDQIARYRQSDAAAKANLLRELFDRGPAGFATAARLATAEDKEDVRALISQAWRDEIDRRVREGLRDDKRAGVVDLLRMRTASGDEKAFRDYAVFLLLTGSIDEAIEHHEAYSSMPGRKREARVLGYLHRIKGDLAAARAVAGRAEDPHLLQATLWDMGDWKALAALGDRLAGEDATPDFRAVFHRLAGDEVAFGDSVAFLMKTAEAKDPSDGTIWWEAKTLFLNSRPAEALRVMARTNDDTMTYEILVRQRRYREALKLLETFRSHDGQGKAWALVRKVKLLHHLGERDAAAKLLPEAVKVAEAGFYPYVQGALLTCLRELGRGEEATRIATRLLEKGVPSPKQQPPGSQWSPQTYADTLLRSLFDSAGTLPRNWWEFLRRRHPQDAVPETLKRMRLLFDGKMAPEALGALVRDLLASAEKQKKENLGEWFEAAVEAARRAGDDALLRRCLEATAAGLEDESGHLKLVKYLLRRKSWGDAAEACGAALKRHPDSAPLLYLHGDAVGRAGKGEEGRRLQARARLMPLGDELRRHYLATEIEEIGSAEEARTEFALLTRCGERDSWYTGNAWRQLSRFARGKDELAAAGAWERWYLRVIRRGTFFLENEPYVWVPYRGHFLKARGLLARGDAQAALREARAALAILPGEVDVATAFVPALAKAGLKREADELYAAVTGVFAATLKDYPRCGWALNARAWAAARCGRDLDAALDDAKGAAKLESENASYLDTLAEVYFQRGERELAVEVMRRCVRLAPESTYYRGQLKRIEAGDRAAPLPE